MVLTSDMGCPCVAIRDPLHVHLLDANAQHEKEALGIVGVNLLYAAFYQRASPESLIRSLMHKLPDGGLELAVRPSPSVTL